MRSQRSSSKAAAVSNTCGKLVAARTAASKWSPLPEVARPCSASFHHLYPGTPSRGTPGAWSPSCAIFSAAVSRDTRSAARCAGASVTSQNARPSDASADDGPHENGGSPATASTGAAPCSAASVTSSSASVAAAML
uniref:Uncharacterized protein n=1 Tax=Zea mays TaxID=4577 RepID=B8A3D4_MAIZE|nr:unknown [Zea mays]ACR36133.1 unknown [Zea mays]